MLLPTAPRRFPLVGSALLLTALAVPISGTSVSTATSPAPASAPSVAPASAAAGAASSVTSGRWAKRRVPNWSFTRGAAHWLATGEHDRLVRSSNGHLDGRAVALRTRVTSTAALNDERNVVAATVRRRIYRAAVWVRTPTPGPSVQLRLREVRDGRELKTSERTLVPSNREWHRIRIQHTASATGSTLDLNVLSWDLRPRQAVVIDDVRLRVRAPRVSTPPVDPGTPTGDDCLRGRGSNADCGVLWGAYTTQVSAAEGWAVPFTRLETDIGRQFDMVKRYHDFSGAGGSGQFPDQYERTLGASGNRTLYFAWTSNVWSTGAITKWRPIANGAYDTSVIEPAARRIKAWGRTVFVDFDHEMDGQTRLANGTAADYIAAYRHIHRVFERMGVTNVVWAWVPTGFMGNRGRIKAMYPGDAYVDWLGFDPYNFYRCHNTGWESPEQSLRPFYEWMSANINNTKPVLLGEYGSVSDPSDPERVRTWYEDVPDALASMGRIKAVMQWSSKTSETCDFRVTRDPQSLLGFRRAGKDPYVSAGP